MSKSQVQWIDEGAYYAYPTAYRDWPEANLAAQRLAGEHGVFTETMKRDDGKWQVITYNDVPHEDDGGRSAS